ncbi:MAG: RnfABCDGE type electron transport complex subunit D [Ruminococcaceae bacterium]|nr:RnfABCDGE type electron transport complex subunit D [Oscillospiraceae bacterium]
MNNYTGELVVSHSPHIITPNSIQRTMLYVIIALIPSLAAATIFFGIRALLLAFVCCFACAGFEFLWNICLKKKNTVSDLSAIVTGLILSLNLPVTLPFYMAVIASLFAIIIVKQFFGGLGHNFMNPALAARAFLLASWAGAMTTFVSPDKAINIFGNADVITSATPLGILKEGGSRFPSYWELFIGDIGGSMGETSTLAILIGGAFLVWKKVITLHTPISYILTVFILGYIGGDSGLFHILTGGIMFGAFFMATDYTTTPTTKTGQIVFGIGCGLITFVIRKWGGYPEGVTYAILLMNVVTPLIDKYIMPKTFGYVKEAKANE